MTAGTWDPDQYERFEAERRQPFDDLAARCRSVVGGCVVDLGCGTGKLTADLHRIVGAASTLGVDSSASMLSAAPRQIAGLTFEVGDLATFDEGRYDLIFSNAAFHWVAHHRALLGRLRGRLRGGGQLAFQIPANFSHPSHTVASDVAREFLDGDLPESRGAHVLAVGEYAEILFALGSVDQDVRLQVYGHVLTSIDDVVEWVKGTLLTPYRGRLDDDAYAAFLAEYRRILGKVLDVASDGTYFYAFPRILCWAQFGPAVG